MASGSPTRPGGVAGSSAWDRSGRPWDRSGRTSRRSGGEGAITQAATKVTSGPTRREERQAVLDGLCLLLDDVLRALRAMARTTSKVHKPRLYSLVSSFGARGKAEEEPEAPAPAPAPTPA